MLTIDSICLPTFFGWSQFERLGVNKADKRTAFCWSQQVLPRRFDVSIQGRLKWRHKGARLAVKPDRLEKYGTGRDFSLKVLGK